MSSMYYTFFMKNKNIFSENLKRLRKKFGLTQEELAKLSGVSRRMITYYETNPAEPSIKRVEKIAKVLNISIEELVGYKKMDVNLKSNFSNIDSRTLKKFKQILSLTPEQRHMVYAFVDSLTNKNKDKKAS